MKRSAAALLPLALAGCVSKPLPARSDVRFDPIRFFYGPTEGRGTLHKLIGSPVEVRVTSVSEGGLNRLKVTQMIQEGGKPARQRVWTIWRLDGDRYTATLTDAAGPIRIEVAGGKARIHYRTKSGLTVDQELALHGDFVAVCNWLTVRKFGVRVAWLNETIRGIPLGGAAPDCIF